MTSKLSTYRKLPDMFMTSLNSFLIIQVGRACLNNDDLEMFLNKNTSVE